MATLSAYTRLDRVGRGSYGEVFKVRRHSDGAELVLKEVSMVGISEQEEREILNETSCMMQLSHPHIISYVGSFLERGSLHIVMEFASGGDLQCLIRRHLQTGDFIIEDRLWKFLIQLTQGLQHAHSRRILHRDIKAQNVFLDANDNIKIGDLGLGKVLGESRCALSQVGTPIYMSPEMCEGKPYDTKSDVWALGCLLFELAALKPPFQAANQTLLARKIIHEPPDSQVPGHYTREIPFIINKLLDKDPRRRPSPSSILNYSAVQIRLERASFQAREDELLAQLEEAKTREARRAIQHASELQIAQQQQKQQSGNMLQIELQVERERTREETKQRQELQREREEWLKREMQLVARIRTLEEERDSERELKEAAWEKLRQREASQTAFTLSSGNDVCHKTHSHALNQICLEHSECVRDELEVSVPGPRESVRTEAIEPERHIEHRSGGAPGSGVRSRTRETEPMPTPSNLFVSPKGCAQSLYTPGSITPSRGNDRMTARERSLESSVERSSKGIVSGMRRTLLTRRSWGEADVMRAGRHETHASSSTSAATPLRGPLRASADSITPCRSSHMSLADGRRERSNDAGDCNDEQPTLCAYIDDEAERPFNDESVECDIDSLALPPALPTPLQAAPESNATSGSQGRNAIVSEMNVDMTPKRTVCATFCVPGTLSNCNTPSAGICSSKRKSSGGEGDVTPSVRTPSASVMTGVIRARQRTPQTSLGPAKRVPLPQHLPHENSGTFSHDSIRAGTLALQAGGRSHCCNGDGMETGDDSFLPPPKFSGLSPKGTAGRVRVVEEETLAKSVADVLALTEGLRRSAQIALNASSSSGESTDSPRVTPTRSTEPAVSASMGVGGSIPARRLKFFPGTP